MAESVNGFAQHLFQPLLALSTTDLGKQQLYFPNSLPNVIWVLLIRCSHTKYSFRTKLDKGSNWAQDVPFAGTNCSRGSKDLHLAVVATAS